MNLLIDRVPKTVMVDNLEYPINTDFRIGLMFEELAEEHISAEEKAEIALNLYYPIKPFNVVDGLRQILWFYQCGKEKTEGKQSKATPMQKAVFSYECDAEYIYSAFMQQYRIDLQDIDNLHWWKFRAMFLSLSDCKFTEIIGYRSANMSDIPKPQKAFYNKMKSLYALPDNRTEEEKEAAIINAFDGCF